MHALILYVYMELNCPAIEINVNYGNPPLLRTVHIRKKAEILFGGNIKERQQHWARIWGKLRLKVSNKAEDKKVVSIEYLR